MIKIGDVVIITLLAMIPLLGYLGWRVIQQRRAKKASWWIPEPLSVTFDREDLLLLPKEHLQDVLRSCGFNMSRPIHTKHDIDYNRVTYYQLWDDVEAKGGEIGDCAFEVMSHDAIQDDIQSRAMYKEVMEYIDKHPDTDMGL